jgi:uncharacterized protein with GYD domain
MWRVGGRNAADARLALKTSAPLREPGAILSAAAGEAAKKIWEEGVMAKYLIHASYTADGLKGLQRDKASGRQQAVRQALESVGGRLESMYYALGEDDVVIIADLPDNVAVSALSLGVSATGFVRTRTTALLTIEETDRALAASMNYRKPGG